MKEDLTDLKERAIHILRTYHSIEFEGMTDRNALNTFSDICSEMSDVLTDLVEKI